MLICIVGPTGVGKTKLSISLAKIFNGEIINSDSVQVYKGLDIGSAKATTDEMDGVVHHLLSFVDVKEDYTIYDYQNDCRQKIKEITSRGHIPILVGGSGLYMKAALYDYKFGEEKNVCEFTDLTNEEIYEKIISYDKNVEVDKNNRRRLVRILNKINNGTYNKDEKSELIYDDVIFIGLTTNRDNLYSIINKRVDKMLNGLLDEVKYFYNQNIRSKIMLGAIGYKEFYQYLDGLVTYDDAVSDIKKNSRHYAKRQYTFFNHQLPVVWFDVNYDNFDETINKVYLYIKEKANL